MAFPECQKRYKLHVYKRHREPGISVYTYTAARTRCIRGTNKYVTNSYIDIKHGMDMLISYFQVASKDAERTRVQPKLYHYYCNILQTKANRTVVYYYKQRHDNETHQNEIP